MEPVEERLIELGHLVARAEERMPGSSVDFQAGRSRFVASVRAVRPVPSWHPSWRQAAPIFALAAVIVAIVWRPWVSPASLETSPAQPLTFHLPGGASGSGSEAWLSAPLDRQMPVRFSDGSSVTLERAARARVAGTTPSGASIVLAEGSAEVSVIGTTSTRWTIAAGPYAVTVTGTRFVVSWDSKLQRLELSMREGSVLVSGPGLEAPRRVSGTESLTVEAPKSPPAPAASEQVAAPAETSPSEPQPKASGSPSAIAPKPAGSDAEPAPATPATPDDWAALAARGRYREALAAALPHYEALCREAPESQLFTLGDTARLAGDSARARRAYLAYRSRFAGGARSADVAFRLGAIAFGSADGEAATWFQRYLSEAPSGSMAREASGRLVEALRRSGRMLEARQAARAYLASYPDGPHADVARAVLSTTSSGSR